MSNLRTLLLAILLTTADFAAGFYAHAWLRRPITVECRPPVHVSTVRPTAEQAEDPTNVDVFVQATARVLLVALDNHVVVVVLVSTSGQTLVAGVHECATDARCKAAVEARLADGNAQKLTLRSGNIAT
jgi:hypothetical protein